MKLPNPYKCDECGDVKLPSNGWLVAFVRSDLRVAIMPWSDRRANSKGATHLCGVGCATKFVAKNVSKQTE